MGAVDGREFDPNWDFLNGQDILPVRLISAIPAAIGALLAAACPLSAAFGNKSNVQIKCTLPPLANANTRQLDGLALGHCISQRIAAFDCLVLPIKKIPLWGFSWKTIPSLPLPSNPSASSLRFHQLTTNYIGKTMAFLGQLQSKLQEIKTQAMPQVSAVLEQANQRATKARQNLMPVLSKCSQQLDTLGKILQANVSPKQSPIDLVPAITAFDPALENATFLTEYDESCQLLVQNLGPLGGLSIRWPPFGPAEQQPQAAGAGQSLLSCSFLPDQQFQLEQLFFHWGTEPMNGSLHTVAGVGYAGEMHFLHRNTKFPNLAEALKHPEEPGVLAFAVFLNETHNDNDALIPLIKVLSNVTYAGTECVLHGGLRISQLVPVEKSKEFWLYDGSEVNEPFRETVKWVVCRSAVPISSHQLEKLRQMRKSRQEDEAEQPLLASRPPQPPNSRLVRSSFKSAAQAELPK